MVCNSLGTWVVARRSSVQACGFTMSSDLCSVDGEVIHISTNRTPTQHLQTDAASSGAQQPWPRRWNWLLDNPKRSSLALRYFIAFLLLFNGVLSILRMTPVFGPQTGAFAIVINVLGLLLIPIGIVWAWSAYRLHRSGQRSRSD